MSPHSWNRSMHDLNNQTLCQNTQSSHLCSQVHRKSAGVVLYSRQNSATFTEQRTPCLEGQVCSSRPLMHEVYYCKSAYVLYNKTLFAIKVSNGDAGNRELRERLQDLCQSDIITEPIYSAPGPHPPPPTSFLCQFSPSLVPRDLCGNNRCTINIGQPLKSKRLMCLLSGFAEGWKPMFVCVKASLCVFPLSKAY